MTLHEEEEEDNLEEKDQETGMWKPGPDERKPEMEPEVVEDSTKKDSDIVSPETASSEPLRTKASDRSKINGIGTGNESGIVGSDDKISESRSGSVSDDAGSERRTSGVSSSKNLYKLSNMLWDSTRRRIQLGLQSWSRSRESSQDRSSGSAAGSTENPDSWLWPFNYVVVRAFEMWF